MCLRDSQEDIIKIDFDDIGKKYIEFEGDCLLLYNPLVSLVQKYQYIPPHFI